MIPWRRRARRERAGGQAALEFALVLPVLLAMTIGLFDLARAVGAYVALSENAREGARYAIYFDATDAQIRSAVKSTPGILGSISDSQITITPTPTRTVGQAVTVSVIYDFAPITPFVGAIRLKANVTKVVQ